MVYSLVFERDCHITIRILIVSDYTVFISILFFLYILELHQAAMQH